LRRTQKRTNLAGQLKCKKETNGTSSPTAFLDCGASVSLELAGARRADDRAPAGGRVDLSSRHPGTVKDLRDRLTAWEKDVAPAPG